MLTYTVRPELEHFDTNTGRWFVTHPEELIATFFLPLPEPLNIPNDCPIRTFLVINRPESQRLATAESTITWFIEPYEPPQNQSGTPEPTTFAINLSNKHLLSSSLMFHTVVGDVAAHNGLDVALMVAAEASRPGITPSEIAALSIVDYKRSMPSAPLYAGIGRVTVVEAAVPLRIVGNIDGLKGVDIGLADLASRAPQFPSDWNPLLLNSITPPTSDQISQRINDALDTALDDIQSIARSYYLITKQPIQLLTRERLPITVPTSIRQYQAFAQKKQGNDVHHFHPIFRVHANLWPVLSTPKPDQTTPQLLHAARYQANGQAFSGGLELQRRARVALHREGDTQLAALLAGVCAETLFDELLLHLQWEDAHTPEAAAAVWTTYGGLDRRVRTLYAPLLGRSWDMTGAGAGGAWAKDTAEVRHRVAHSGYTPTRAEAAKPGCAVI